MERSVFSQILWRYAALEREVQLLIGSRFSVFCSLCPSCCCRTDICEEAFDSAFLKRLHGQERSSVAFSDRYGWLTERGCGLTLGRPPVCYEFFCDEVLAIQKDDTHRYLLHLLGKLVSHVGKNALGHSHLAEISDEADLDRLSLESFKEKLNQARAAMDHVRFFYDNGFFDQNAIEQFRPILDPPEELNV
jgi:hypothetical protein